MNLIITMAGKYCRFKNEGFRVPKYLLPWGKRPVLSELLNQFVNNGFDSIFLVANKHETKYVPHIRNIMRYYDIPLYNLFLIDDTSGQAETAWIGINEICKVCCSTTPTAIHNVDTILYNRDFTSMGISFMDSPGIDGYIDVFKSSNHNYSYVICNDNIVTDIVEKVVVSDWASSGFYGFRSMKIFAEYYNSQKYISEIYKDMIKDSRKIVVSKLHSEQDTLVLGSPSEYMNSAYLLDV